MEHLRFFKTEVDYKNASIEYPNVSLTIDTNTVHIKENDIVIMTSESNPAAMEICYLQGWAANENYMTKSEAEVVTDIGTAFKNTGNPYGITMKKLYSFNEFKYFINVTTIGVDAFYYCYSLSEITIPSGVTSIGDSAFRWCFSLNNITIPNSVTSIGNYAFEDCSSLSEITIPNSVTSIGNYVFCNCSSLSSVTIGNSVTSIGNYAFRYCNSLSDIICLAETAPAILSETFVSIKSNGVLYYPQGSNYSSWMSTDNCYLGYYNWTSQEI